MAAMERVEAGAVQDPGAELPKEPGWSDVKSDVAKTLIEAMQKGETPWQKPWSSQAMRPRNPVTGNVYRGINRVLLSLGGGGANGNGLWVTYRQAQAQGWQVRKGEKGTMIVKVVELDPGQEQPSADGQQGATSEKSAQRRNVILRRYFVFGAHQIDGMPELAQPGELDFHPVEKAEAILAAMQERTGLRILHGKKQACYVPAMDEIHLPNKKSFKSVYDYYATAMHEVGHSTLHPKRLDRKEALAKRWGDEAYSLEELRAEIHSAILAAELGIELTEAQRAKHMANHAGYLQSWIKAISRDPSAVFTAAKDAERMVEYVLGIERQAMAVQEHAEWVAEYDAAQER